MMYVCVECGLALVRIGGKSLFCLHLDLMIVCVCFLNPLWPLFLKNPMGVHLCNLFYKLIAHDSALTDLMYILPNSRIVRELGSRGLGQVHDLKKTL
jgi:hypothetical protein